jgi:hypothetical protein
LVIFAREVEVALVMCGDAHHRASTIIISTVATNTGNRPPERMIDGVSPISKPSAEQFPAAVVPPQHSRCELLLERIAVHIMPFISQMITPATKELAPKIVSGRVVNKSVT